MCMATVGVSLAVWSRRGVHIKLHIKLSLPAVQAISNCAWVFSTSQGPTFGIFGDTLLRWYPGTCQITRCNGYSNQGPPAALRVPSTVCFDVPCQIMHRCDLRARSRKITLSWDATRVSRVRRIKSPLRSIVVAVQPCRRPRVQDAFGDTI